MKVLLVAKPWKGGLGRYYFSALQDAYAENVEWISTRPEGFTDYVAFQQNPQRWWRALLDKIDRSTCDVAIFIGFRKEYRDLKPNNRNILYIVDDVCAVAGDLDAFGQVYLSDPGYANELKTLLPETRYAGVLPFAAYPAVHHSEAAAGSRRDVCFIGNRDVKRDPLLEALLDCNIRSTVIGNYFMKSPLFWNHPLSFRPQVQNEAMGAIYARHKISLNIHAQVVRGGTNMRTFECAAYGIPQVIEYQPGLENYFEPDREILCYRGADEMVVQLEALLHDAIKREAMAERARRRVLKEHTYAHRIKTIMRQQ